MVDVRDLNKKITLDRIKQAISKEPKSIAQLSRELNIKRTTLNYYISLLEVEQKVQRERVEEKVTGRPTIISLTPEEMNKRKNKEKNQLKKNIEILNYIKQKKNPTQDELIENFSSKENFADILTILYSLDRFGYIKNCYQIQEKGEKFLKSNKTK